jgi:hypothetical protein
MATKSTSSGLSQPSADRQEEGIDRMSFQLPKEMGQKLRDIVERRNIGISTFVRHCVEDGIERESVVTDPAGRMRITLWASREHARAILEAARLFDTDAEHIVQRILRENIGHLLTKARQEHIALVQALGQEDETTTTTNNEDSQAHADREPGTRK